MNNKLTWILALKDLISQPARAINNTMKTVNEQFQAVGKSSVRSGQDMSNSLKEAKGYLKTSEDLVKKYEKRVADLEKELSKMTGGSKQWRDQQNAILKAKASLGYYQEQLIGAKEDYRVISREVNKFNHEQERISLGITNWNQLTEVVEKFARALDFSENYKDIEGKIQLMTNQTGQALTDSTRDVYKLSKVYKSSGNDIANTANAISKAYGVSFDEAIDKIEEGYKKGANLSGGMLGILKEYGPLMQEMGYSLDDFIARMAHANKEGLNVSKSFQALSQGSVALKKMTDDQKKALEGIGLFPDDLKGKTIKEAMEMVGGALDAAGSTVQDKQMLLSSLFRMQGERMGNGLVTALFESTDNLEDMPIVEEAGAQIKGFMADVQSWLADTMGGVAIGLQQLAPVFTGIGSGITLFQTLSRATMFQTVAIKALSVATGVFNAISMAGPWGWIALAIGAVIGAVVLLSNKFEWAAGVVGAAKASFKDFGSIILQLVLLPIDMVVSSLGAIGKAISALFKKDWGGAVDALKGASAPVQKLMDSAGSFGKNVAKGYSEGVNKHQAKKSNTQSVGTIGPDSVKVDFADKVPEVSGASKSGGGSSKSGMSISGGGSGRGLVMNLNIVNNFNGRINSREDIRQLAEEVMGVVVDRGRDFVLSI